MRMLRTLLSLAVVVGACQRTPAPEPARSAPIVPEPAATAAKMAVDSSPAGQVIAVEGRVTAQRAQQSVARELAVAATVFADDTVQTSPDASVAIRLTRNGAVWELQGGLQRRVDQSAVWNVNPQAALLADKAQAPTTASAGRHSETEAGQTGEAAVRPAPAPAAAAQAPEIAAKTVDHDEARRNAREAVQKRAIAGAFGSGPMTKLFAADDGEDNTLGGKRASGEVGVGPAPSEGVGKGSGSGGRKDEKAVAVQANIGMATGSSDEGINSMVGKVVARKLPAIRACYEQVLRTDPTDKGGKMILEFTVGTEGTMTAVTVTGVSAAIGECVKPKLLATRGLPVLEHPQVFKIALVLKVVD